MDEYGGALAPPHCPNVVPPCAMYRLNEMLRSSMSFRLPMNVSTPRVSCGLPQWSNQPVQYSLHMSGLFGNWRLRLRNSLSTLEPAPKLMHGTTPSTL